MFLAVCQMIFMVKVLYCKKYMNIFRKYIHKLLERNYSLKSLEEINFSLIFTSITWLPLCNRNIAFGQKFRCPVFAWFICFEAPWAQKCTFWNSLVFMIVCVCVCVWLYGGCCALYISKTNKDRNIKFYMQYQVTI